MEGLNPGKFFTSFAEAHEYASGLARRHHSEAGIQNEANGWRVYVSHFIKRVLDVRDWSKKDEEIDLGSLDEGRFEALAEIMSNEDDFTRSEESGWYYEDED